LKNGQTVKKAFVLSENTKICKSLLEILWDEGYILGYKVLPTENKLKIYLKYKKGVPVIRSIESISRPGLRVYCSLKDLERFRSFIIVSTNLGLRTLYQCRRLKVGGEPIIKII
jgi:small subunit ribosomal protein S8